MQVLSGQQLHHDVGYPFVVIEVVDRDDVRVRQPSRCASLQLESPQRIRIIGSEQDLNRYFAHEIWGICAKYPAISSLAEDFSDAVSSDLVWISHVHPLMLCDFLIAIRAVRK